MNNQKNIIKLNVVNSNTSQQGDLFNVNQRDEITNKFWQHVKGPTDTNFKNKLLVRKSFSNNKSQNESTILQQMYIDKQVQQKQVIKFESKSSNQHKQTHNIANYFHKEQDYVKTNNFKQFGMQKETFQNATQIQIPKKIQMNIQENYSSTMYDTHTDNFGYSNLSNNFNGVLNLTDNNFTNDNYYRSVSLPQNMVESQSFSEAKTIILPNNNHSDIYQRIDFSPNSQTSNKYININGHFIQESFNNKIHKKQMIPQQVDQFFKKPKSYSNEMNLNKIKMRLNKFNNNKTNNDSCNQSKSTTKFQQSNNSQNSKSLTIQPQEISHGKIVYYQIKQEHYLQLCQQIDQLKTDLLNKEQLKKEDANIIKKIFEDYLARQYYSNDNYEFIRKVQSIYTQIVDGLFTQNEKMQQNFNEKHQKLESEIIELKSNLSTLEEQYTKQLQKYQELWQQQQPKSNSQKGDPSPSFQSRSTGTSPMKQNKIQQDININNNINNSNNNNILQSFNQDQINEIINAYEEQIGTMKDRELKFIKLLLAIQKKGVNIESIYQEEVSSGNIVDDEEEQPTNKLKLSNAENIQEEAQQYHNIQNNKIFKSKFNQINQENPQLIQQQNIKILQDHIKQKILLNQNEILSEDADISCVESELSCGDYIISPSNKEQEALTLDKLLSNFNQDAKIKLKLDLSKIGQNNKKLIKRNTKKNPQINCSF